VALGGLGGGLGGLLGGTIGGLGGRMGDEERMGGDRQEVWAGMDRYGCTEVPYARGEEGMGLELELGGRTNGTGNNRTRRSADSGRAGDDRGLGNVSQWHPSWIPRSTATEPAQR